MRKEINKSSRSKKVEYKGQHRFEHWLVDNQVYFISARCRDRYSAFVSHKARDVFWDRFGQYSQEYGFTPWVTSLLTNHYHTLGYLREGKNLSTMMQRIHGSVAKLVNDLLPERRSHFWRDDARGQEYFDGCIRDETQARRAYRYTLRQSVRHGLATRWEDYPDTQVNIELERAIHRSHELRAFMERVPYKRYLKS